MLTHPLYTFLKRCKILHNLQPISASTRGNWGTNRQKSREQLAEIFMNINDTNKLISTFVSSLQKFRSWLSQPNLTRRTTVAHLPKRRPKRSARRMTMHAPGDQLASFWSNQMLVAAHTEQSRMGSAPNLDPPTRVMSIFGTCEISKTENSPFYLQNSLRAGARCPSCSAEPTRENDRFSGKVSTLREYFAANWRQLPSVFW